MKKLMGFTLVELMLVMGVLGILMAVAIPMYQNYTVRVKVGEGLSLMSSVKLAVTETRQSLGTFPSSNVQAGIAGSIRTAYVSNIQISNGGVIEVQFNDAALGLGVATNSTIVMTPTIIDSAVDWDCKGGDLPTKYRPLECR